MSSDAVISYVVQDRIFGCPKVFAQNRDIILIFSNDQDWLHLSTPEIVRDKTM